MPPGRARRDQEHDGDRRGEAPGQQILDLLADQCEIIMSLGVPSRIGVM